MKGAWPRVDVSWSRRVTILHALPALGNPDTHAHEFLVRFGWEHEINPRFGHCGFSVEKCDGMLGKLLALIEGKYLNALMPPGFAPTAENLACWLLVRCPGFVAWIEIDCYEAYRVRAERGMRSEMETAYLNGDSVLEMTV